MNDFSALPPEKILVFRYRFLGDTILTVPFLRNLKQLYPQAWVAVLVAPQSGVLLENCPYVDELIDFDTTRFHKYDSPAQKPRLFWSYIHELRARRFSRAYLLKRSLSSALLAYLAGIPQRIGFDTECRGCLLTERIPFQPNRAEVLNFLAHLPAPYNTAEPDSTIRNFWPTAAERGTATALCTEYLNPRQQTVLFHAPAAHPQKMWTVAAWTELLRHFKGRGWQVMFSGSPQDAPYYQQIEEAAGLKADLNLCISSTNLRENVACYEHCTLAVCVDSGPMHLAAAVGLPVVGLFGPTDPVRWHPWTPKASLVQPDFGQSLDRLPVEKVLTAITELCEDAV